MKRKFIICVFITVIAFEYFQGTAQPLRRLNSFSYNISDGLLQSSIYDMNFDSLGFMWLSFETGLQRYDGNNFTNIPVQKGLPFTQYIKFIKSKNGTLWLCHSKGISVYNAATNTFKQVFTYISKEPMPSLWIVNEDDGVVYFFESDGYIIGINENTSHVTSKSRFPFTTNKFEVPPEFETSGLPVNHEVTICFDKEKIITWNLQKGIATRIKQLPDTIFFSGQEFYPLNNSELMFFSKGQLEIFNLETRYSTCYKKSLNQKSIDGLSFQPINNHKILVSENNELFQLNTETMEPLTRIVNFQNQPFANFPISFIRLDNFGNIYVITRHEGFVKLLANTYPISYYGTPFKKYNFITSLETDKKNNRVLAGALNSGLLVFDTLQQLQGHIKDIGSFQKPGPLTIVCIIHLDNDNYLLFPRLNADCVLWNAVSGKYKNVPVKFVYTQSSFSANNTSKYMAYYNSKISLGNHRELIAIDQNLYEVNFSGNKPAVKAFAFTYRTKGLCRFENFIVSGTDNKLFFRDTLNYTVINEITLPDCEEIRCIESAGDTIYAGTDHGLYKLHGGKVISVLTKQNGLPDDCIYSVAVDENKIWCSTNKGIIGIGNDNSILHLRKEDGSQDNEFNTNIVARQDNGELFFGGVNGISSFYPDQISNGSDLPKVFLTTIKVNDEEIFKDSAAWMIKQIHLPYDHNNLYVEFTALGKRNAGQYFYQYKMSGIDKSWIKNSEVRNARYLLPPGRYLFYLCAGDVYNENPTNIKTVEIIIGYPFWKTWWFSIIVVFFCISIIALIVWQYLHSRYQKKLRVLELQSEIQLERERISRNLHDNIGAQLSFISSSIDWVIDKNTEMDKEEELRQMKAINATAKNVMMNLRETLWALDKDRITLQEFGDKLKVYIRSMLQLQPQIECKIEENIEKNFILTPAEMLNIFRICQECLNNILKHARASSLRILIHADEKYFHISMEDNGIGFDSTKISEGHYGLKNMRFRAEEVKAELSIKSTAGMGTLVEIKKYSK